MKQNIFETHVYLLQQNNLQHIAGTIYIFIYMYILNIKLSTITLEFELKVEEKDNSKNCIYLAVYGEKN